MYAIIQHYYFVSIQNSFKKNFCPSKVLEINPGRLLIEARANIKALLVFCDGASKNFQLTGHHTDFIELLDELSA